MTSKIRSTLPLLSRTPAPTSPSSQLENSAGTPTPAVPTIRLISATPSAAGSAGDDSASFSAVAPFASSPLAPRPESQASRKRIVPKKSKLGLLGGTSKNKDKFNKDLSDVVRRVGGSQAASTGGGGFEIYVDHADDPEIGEIVVVKKKKSRLGLDGMKWGALGEVTNVPPVPKEQKHAPVEHLLKVKGDDSQKWWSIGRGRKDSKGKDKENENAQPSVRSKTPEPIKALDPRARFNSLDSGVVLSGFSSNEACPGSAASTQTTFHAADPATMAPSGLLVPEPNTNGSIAVRAIKSMRSLARMASWAQLGNPEKDIEGLALNSTTTKSRLKEKEKGEKKKKKKDKKDVKEKEREEKEKTVRNSGSSFEAGALSVQASPVPPTVRNTSAKTLGRKKQSSLGLGLPSTMKLATIRNVSSSSSAGVTQAPSRLSADSAHLVMNANGRPTSIISSGSSLRPPSTVSGGSMFSERSGRSSSSSVVSVRWDEEGIRSSKETQRKERRSREQEVKTARTGRESRRASGEGRKRTAIVDIFPDAQVSRPASISPPPSVCERPIVTVEEATSDGHSDGGNNDSVTETPPRRARPRPVSEQMLGRARPQPICEDDDGMMSMLDQATNDLALLINRLDLEATPCSANGSPLRLSPRVLSEESPLKKRAAADSPLKQELRESTASIQSLRPYAEATKATSVAKDPRRLIGQQILPWSELDWKVSPRKGPTSKVAPARPTHKRTLTPTPALDPPFVFQPLRPAKAKAGAAVPPTISGLATPPIIDNNNATPSSATFGTRPSKVGKSPATKDDPAPSPTPVFKRKAAHHRRGSSLAALDIKLSEMSMRFGNDSTLISSEARRDLAMSGTMGGSGSTEPPVDPEDPDSDIPDELQVILSGQPDDDCTRRLDDTLSRHSSPSVSPVSPPQISLPLPPVELSGMNLGIQEVLPMPLFQLNDDEANQADVDEGINSGSEDDTKKSFDFTGELQKLNESGGSDRRSFVEQLENAFKTPARIELGYGLGESLGLGEGFLAVPHVPALPANLRPTPPEDTVPCSVTNPADMLEFCTSSYEYRDSCVTEDLSFALDQSTEDECRILSNSKRSESMRSRASDGQLNVDFRFGGLPSPSIPETVEEKQEKPLTLSDIIPPLSHHTRSTSQSSIIEDDSVLKSIMAKASDLPPRRRALSDSSSKQSTHASVQALYSAGSHARHDSEMSFVGFESFEEVRRGFEFAPNRSAFCPPPGATTHSRHARGESIFSIASVSSYGAVLDSGVADPFGYGSSRPQSLVSMSMSMSVDDTFSFIYRGRRQRVDSDASSFYFQVPGSQAQRRGHRRHESGMSIASNAPPVSLYNRSFGAHRRNDSNTSVSSVAHSYAMYGAHGGRAAWARHRQDQSVDSSWSDSSQHLCRPGLGDKMFNTEQGMPLTAISASPPESLLGDLQSRASWDSFDEDKRRSSMDDSLFDKSDDRTSMSSDSVFGHSGPYSQYATQLPAHQFRPLSVMSEDSVHSPRKDDDTMLTMFDGGRVRRRSLNSMVGGSPCVRVERAKHTALPQTVLQFQTDDMAKVDSPNKSRLLEKPSIASTSSHQFGGERMIMARRGLLERQSLEDSALIAQGEDLMASLRSQTIFVRLEPVSRSRSSTVTSLSGAETPPLSSSESVTSGSQSSIDLGHLNTLLMNTTYPSHGFNRARARARARGTGHRRRISQARASRSSVYETIQEESYIESSPSPAQTLAPESPQDAVSLGVCDSVFIVDGDNESILSDWDDERGISTLRRYYALREEAHETVTESRRMWIDTPFSIYAVQSFRPPQNRGGMRAMLEHSQKTYGPLPSDLRPHRVRSRTSSRASPYPLRNVRATLSPEKPRPLDLDVQMDMLSQPTAPVLPVPSIPSVQSVLRDVKVNTNTVHDASPPPPALDVIKPFTPFTIEFDKSKQGKENLGVPLRPRVTSSARRTALGWTKRNASKFSSSDQKENISQDMRITPAETLRINRPRPRGRPTPARALAPAA